MEVLADAVGSVGVLVADVIMITTGWGYADIVVAVLIALWVVPRALSLLLDTARILSQQAPKHIDVDAVRHELAAIPGVDDVHDLHVWTLTTGMDVATVHLASVESTESCSGPPAKCSPGTDSATPPSRWIRPTRAAAATTN